MKRYILHKLLILLGILLLVSCRQDDSAQTAGTASLQLNIKALENTLQTRGVEDLNDDGTVSEAEAIVDGRKMYHLSVFLLDGNTVIVDNTTRDAVALKDLKAGTALYAWHSQAMTMSLPLGLVMRIA